jgi:hypothetical protein
MWHINILVSSWKMFANLNSGDSGRASTPEVRFITCLYIITHSLGYFEPHSYPLNPHFLLRSQTSIPSAGVRFS